MEEQYTLEEIIAEVKSGKLSSPPDTAAPEDGAVPRRARPEPEVPRASVAPQPGHAAPEEAAGRSADEQDQAPRLRPASPPPARPQEPVVERTEPPRHQPPEQPQASATEKARSAARAKILEFPEAGYGEEDALEPEKPRRRPRAPWRTQAPADWEAEPEDDTLPPEDEDGEGVHTAPNRPYDLSNPSFDDAGQGAAYCTAKTASLSARILFMLPLLAVSVYMTLAPMLALPMPPGFTYTQSPFLYILVLCGIEVCAMLLAADVTGAGLYRLAVFRPTLDSAVLFSCLCTLAHAVSIIAVPEWGGYLPYSCVSVLVCLLAVMAKRQRADILKRAYKICQVATAPTAVKRIRMPDGTFAAVKTQQGAYPDVERLAGPSRTERVSTLYAPIVIIACLVLAGVATFGQGQGQLFLWALAALSSVCVPLLLLFASTGPARRVAKKLFTSGAALLGSRGAARLSRCREAVLRDGDLFPAGSIAITGMKLSNSMRMEDIIGTAAAVFSACGSGVAKAFSDFARQQYIIIKQASDFRFFETGGMSANVGGHYVLAGTPSFLLRMGVHVSLSSKMADGLCLAIDSAFAGVFTIKYAVQPQAFSTFRVLQRCRLRPVLATVFFGLTQALVEKRFELRSGGADYPDMADRIDLSAPECGRREEPLALLSRDSAMAFAEAAGGARQQCRAEKLGIAIGLISAAIGLFFMYFLVVSFKASSATPYNVLLFLLLWEVPALLCGLLITKF